MNAKAPEPKLKRKVNHPPLLVALIPMPRKVIEMSDEKEMTTIQITKGQRREINVLAAQRDMTYSELIWKMIIAYKKFGKEL